MRIRLYGRLADVLGPDIEIPEARGCSVGDVRRQVAERHAGAAGALARSRGVIDGLFVPDERLIGEADRLEFLPPVSGG